MNKYALVLLVLILTLAAANGCSSTPFVSVNATATPSRTPRPTFTPRGTRAAATATEEATAESTVESATAEATDVVAPTTASTEIVATEEIPTLAPSDTPEATEAPTVAPSSTRKATVAVTHVPSKTRPPATPKPPPATNPPPPPSFSVMPDSSIVGEDKYFCAQPGIYEVIIYAKKQGDKPRPFSGGDYYGAFVPGGGILTDGAGKNIIGVTSAIGSQSIGSNCREEADRVHPGQSNGKLDVHDVVVRGTTRIAIRFVVAPNDFTPRSPDVIVDFAQQGRWWLYFGVQ